MLFLIREVLIVNWGKEERRKSLFASKPALANKAAYPVDKANGKGKAH